MMRCGDFLAILYISDQSVRDEGDRRAFEKHLEICSTCRYKYLKHHSEKRQSLVESGAHLGGSYMPSH